MSEVRLIGLGGYATSGKDTVADHLVDRYGWSKTFMSKPLLTSMLRLNPIIGHEAGELVRYDDLYKAVGYDRSKNHTEVRELLQRLGTEVGREVIGPDVWIDVVFREVVELLNILTTVEKLHHFTKHYVDPHIRPDDLATHLSPKTLTRCSRTSV